MSTVYTVGEVNSYIHSVFEKDARLRRISVKGELSNVKYHSSGHIYFTLKDDTSAIAGVMFSSNARSLDFRLTEGKAVTIIGSIGTYERDGKYQIYALSAKPSGDGELYEKYEKLKKELEEMGMFAPSYKQPIPAYVKTLGVVTAATGAAVRDIIKVSTRRFPYIQIVLYPAKVQGEGAAESICAGIRALERYGVDCMIVGRGGGSIEDLWAFNEEIVARTIFDCSIPVISAVGHETDTTIADWVADLRAATPSAAAEMAVFDYYAFKENCVSMQHALEQRMQQKIARYRVIRDKYASQLEVKNPVSVLRQEKIRCDMLYDKLSVHMKRKIDDARRRNESYPATLRRLFDGRLDGAKRKNESYPAELRRLFEGRLKDRKQKAALLVARLEGLSPLLKLSQGYSLTENEAGQVVSSIERVRVDDAITVHVLDGDIKARVTDVEGQDYGKGIRG